MADLKYPFGKRAQLGGTGGPVDWDSDPIYVMLVNTTYAALSDATKKTHDFRDDATSNEISGTGYTTGGVLLASASIVTDGADGYKVTFTNPSWATATITAYGAIFYKRVGADLTTPADDPLLLFSDFGGAVTSTADTFTLTIPAGGLFAYP